MTAFIKIKVTGKPVAKARPRFARRGKFVKTYSDQETEESRFYMLAKEQLYKRDVIPGPIGMLAIFEFERPKSHFGTGRNAGRLKPSAPGHHIKKPDGSNLVKFVEDVLNGLAWADDSQIVDLTVVKRFAAQAATTLYITELED